MLALELLKILLENSGPAFRGGDKFIAAIRQYLCVSLLKNIASSMQAVTQLSASIFLTLMHKFRSSLKAEVGGHGEEGRRVEAKSCEGMGRRRGERCGALGYNSNC